MSSLIDTIASQDWTRVATDMHARGYALLPKVLSAEQCLAAQDLYAVPDIYRKTVVMARHRFGLGEYKYWRYPLPDMVQTLRQHIYPHLVPIANGWMHALGMDKRFPLSLAELQTQCAAAGQYLPTPLMLKYGVGGFNTLHQDLYGEVFFPMQLVLFLNQPEREYSGGEFVLTEQVPRAQSQAIVLRPGQGDMMLITTQFRPVKGVRGYYRANMKHGVSAVTSGQRHTLGVIFHDAAS
jgi:uncharacterized protein